MTPAEIARLRAALAEALQRREALEYRWAVAEHTSSGTDDPEAIDVELAQVAAMIAELEEALVGAAASAAPVPAAAPPAAPVPAAAPPAAPAVELPEYLDTRQAAALLGTTAKALEGLRRRGTGPAFIRLGKRVRYRRVDLLSTVQGTVQRKPSKPGDGT